MSKIMPSPGTTPDDQCADAGTPAPRSPLRRPRAGERQVWTRFLTEDERDHLAAIEATLRQLYQQLSRLRDKGVGRARHALATPEQHAAKRARRLELVKCD